MRLYLVIMPHQWSRLATAHSKRRARHVCEAAMEGVTRHPVTEGSYAVQLRSGLPNAVGIRMHEEKGEPA